MNGWQAIDSAPFEKRVLVYGSGGVMIAIKDAMGNWRQRHHGPYRHVPTYWMPLPEPPK